jgi:uncharacterized membrane protein
MFRARFAKKIREEINTWDDQGLLPEGLADTLTARYPDPISGINATIIATIFGAILVGAGVLLFIAGNWDGLGAWLKVFLIAVSILLSSYFGWRCRFEPGNHPKLGTALLLIAQFFYGGGIWLIGQIFNLSTDFAAGLFLWTIGTLAVALATRLPTLSIMAAVLGGSWLINGIENNVLQVLAFTGISLVFSMYVRSRWTLTCALVAAAIAVLTKSAVPPIGLVWYGLALFTLRIAMKERSPIVDAPLKYAGAISAMLGFLTLTFEATYNHSDNSFMAYGVCALGCIVWAWIKSSENEKQILVGTMLSLLLSVCVFLIPGGAWQKLMTYSVDLIITAGMIYSGARLKDQSFVNMGIVFLALFVIARYFDSFFMALDRSAFFIVGGGLLLAAGYVMERSRRKLIQGWQ